MRPPAERVETVRGRLEEAARKVIQTNGGSALAEDVYSVIDDNSIVTKVYLTDADTRPLSTTEFTEKWRNATGTIAGIDRIRFAADSGGPGSGAALTVRLSHSDAQTLDEAAARLGAALPDYAGVSDVDDGVNRGKTQFDLRLTPYGLSLGLTSADVARQVRNAFYGAEPISQQRGRNEVTVRVRRAGEERTREDDIERFLVKTPDGGDVLLTEVADIQRDRAYTSIDRVDGARFLDITASVDPSDAAATVEEAIYRDVVSVLQRDYPGLTVGKGGRQTDIADSLVDLGSAFIVCMLLIYLLLAIPFASYTQPAIVIAAIPFGIVGAVLGHLVMGFSLSVISIMGIVALSGVVINDSLVMITVANEFRVDGHSAHDAVVLAGTRRLRPILLTTFTTFGGLAPMILETSRQARFMVPMAISLGYGLIFATAITLILIPALYVMLNDILRRFPSGRGLSDGEDLA